MLYCLRNYITCRGTTPQRLNHVAALSNDKVLNLYIWRIIKIQDLKYDLYPLDLETVSELCWSRCVYGLYCNNMELKSN